MIIRQIREAVIKGFVIAGAKSGCGKTTLTLGILAALMRRGFSVAPFKVGPDFIDPGHHGAISGVASRNLDGWMLSREYNRNAFRHHAAGTDLAVVEGVMGLFDGYDGKSEAGSTAQMAKWLSLPTVLIVDAGSMARSAAALVQGFERFDADLNFAGVIFNRIGSERHLAYLEEALADHVEMPCLGGVPRQGEISIPERHLGLVTTQEFAFSEEFIEKLADLAESCIRLDLLLKSLPEISAKKRQPPADAASGIRIGVASDAAFCFYYPDNLDLLRRAGAEIIFFSPLKDPHLPPDMDGLYIGGGYPEVFARTLADNAGLRKEIRKASRDGMPIYAECGGFMYLCRSLQDQEKKAYPMTGCFPFETAMFPRLRSLGYREVRLKAPTVFGDAGLKIRGHEFHYSGILRPEADFGHEPDADAGAWDTVYAVAPRTGGEASPEGYRIGRTLGSYIHLHFGSEPALAPHFVQTCREYRKEREKL